MRFNSFLFLGVILLMPFFVLGQGPVEKGIEFLLANQLEEDGFDVAATTQELERYLMDPLNINHSSWERLVEFPFFSLVHVHHLLTYYNRKGAIRTKKEMYLLPQFTPALIEVIQPFITFEAANDAELMTLHSRPKHQTKVLHRFIPLLNFHDSSKGVQLAWWNRVQINRVVPNINFNLNQEKDAGERYFYADNSMEYATFNLEYSKASNFVKRTIVGAYRLSLGEGLVMKKGFNDTKLKFNYGSVSFQSSSLKAHVSGNESGYLNGAAVVLGTNKVIYTCFASRRELDARLDIDAAGDTIATTIYETGKHETSAEIASRNQLKSNTIGHQLSYDWGTKSLSFNQVLNLFDYTLKPTLNYYNQHRFNGKISWTQSLSWKSTHKGQLCFGELAIDKNGKSAAVFGLSGTLFQVLNYGVVWRRYAKDYHSFHGQSYQQQSNLGNERGLAIRVETALSDNWMVLLLVDHYRFPFMKYLTQFSSSGYERKIRFEYRSKIKLNIQYKVKKNEKSVAMQEETRSYFMQERHGFSVQAVFNWSTNWRYKLGISKTLVRDTSIHKQGVLFFQDIQFKGEKYTINCRTTVHSINDFAARIYLYENSLLYSSPFNMFNGTGFSAYVNWNWLITPAIKLSAKISYANQLQKVVSTTNLSTVGMRFQLQYEF